MITSSTGKATSKTKIEIGVPEENSVMWVPFDLTSDDRELLGNWNMQLCIDEQIGKDSTKIVDEKNYPLVDAEEYRKPHQRIRRELHKWLEANRPAITETAERFAVITALTPEQLQKKVQSMEATLARSKKMLEDMQRLQDQANATKEKATK